MVGFNIQFSINDFKRMYSCFYDFRNFGHSGAANGGIITADIFEARDVIGSLNYVCSRKDLREMTTFVCSAVVWAATLLCSPWPQISRRVPECPLHGRGAAAFCLRHAWAVSGSHRNPRRPNRRSGRSIRLYNSFKLDDMSPVEVEKSVKIPIFLYQVHDDVMTRPSNIQAIYDNIPIEEKKLFWIKGTSRR